MLILSAMKPNRAGLLVATIIFTHGILCGQSERKITEIESFRGAYSIQGDEFGIWNGRGYSPFFVKGINLGVSVPGTLPGQLAASGEDYRRWFRLIREAGYNTIRTYTLHYPRFYEEIRNFNLANPQSPLLVIQGIWLMEQPEPADLYNLTGTFGKEIREVVSAVHGDIVIPERPGQASGTYTSDISPWVAGYLIGREIFPREVALTNEAHPEETGYHGTYFHLQEADPVEVWLAVRLDSLSIYEAENYGSIRPVGVSTWPTLDPLSHPTEALLPGSLEDTEKIDLSRLVASDSSAGFFIGYHAYPYYPDFIVQDPGYRAGSDPEGPNSYLGYLKDLKAHYADIPLVIAEFGVPSSWGSGHLSPTGMHHGGITEEQQGRYTIRMLDNIRQAGCAGGIQFSLIDEWFKQTWITNPLSDAAYRHYWHNIAAPEQNFGILSYLSPPVLFRETGSYPGKPVARLRAASDYAFFMVRVYMDTEEYNGDTLWVAFDTYDADLGESLLPDGTSIGGPSDTLRSEFALRILLGGEQADLFVIPSYDVYGIRDPVRLDTVVSLKSDEGLWNRVRWKTNYFYDITQYIGRLRITGSDDPFTFLNAVSVYNDSLEIRIPWTLLNFYAPTVMRALHYVSRLEGGEIHIESRDTLSDGIAVTVSLGNELYRSDRYRWDPWDHEKIMNHPPLERKKQGFHYLEQELPAFNSLPVGFPDTFHIFPGGILEVSGPGGLLANDFDIDGNPIRANLAFGSDVRGGSLHLHPDGSFLYEPEDGFRGEDFFMYYLSDGYGHSGLVPVTIHVDFALAGQNIPQADFRETFRVYPNPANNQVFIAGFVTSGTATVTITDMKGREIAMHPVNGPETVIPTVDLSPGIYLFRIRAGKYEEWHRVLIQ